MFVCFFANYAASFYQPDAKWRISVNNQHMMKPISSPLSVILWLLSPTYMTTNYFIIE